MNISIIGCGYVGAVTGACLAELGHKIVWVDSDEKKVDLINSAQSPIHESQLGDLIKKNRGNISATVDFKSAIEITDTTFVCVGTPPNSDDSINLDYIESACASIGFSLKTKENFHVIIVKSTVLPGTTEGTVKTQIERASGKEAFKDFGLASNPEFLREGVAVEDFFHPDRIIIGTRDKQSSSILDAIYSSFGCRKIFTDIKTAEMVKYASNAFLATKISFANEIGNLCKAMGIDAYEVFNGVGLDKRINPSFFRAGIGFGGSCFPKDVRALMAKMRKDGINPRILKSVLETNDDQPLKLIELLERHLGNAKGKRIGVLGLAFKPETDDVRECRAAIVIERLLESGAEIIAFDPIAMDTFRDMYPKINIKYAQSPCEALETDAILILTEWEAFNNLNYSGKIVIDGRRVERARREAATYEGICW
jgi:UDPglucose 6-dehydrogenase